MTLPRRDESWIGSWPQQIHPDDDLPPGAPVLLSRLAARVVATKASDETFSGASIAREVNQRYGKRLWGMVSIQPFSPGVAITFDDGLMATIGAWRIRRGQAVWRIDRFAYGYLFALGLALVRFQFTQ